MPSQSSKIPPVCRHRIAPIILASFDHCTACPACRMHLHITQIREVQSHLKRRGGIFASKGRALTNGRAVCKKKWREAKLMVANDVGVLEALRKQYPQHAERWGVRETLEVWYKVQEECAKVPGYGYEPDVMENDLADPETQDQINAGVKEDEKQSSPLSKCFRRKKQKDRKADKAKTAIQQVVESSDDSSIDSQHQHDMAFVTETLSNLTLSSWTPSSTSLLTSPSSSRSAFKGIRTSSLTPQPRVIITNTTTSLSCPSSTSPHNWHTLASTARYRLRFKRTSSAYEAGTWASAPGYEKLDTSFMREDWDNVMRAEMEEQGDDRRFNAKFDVLRREAEEKMRSEKGGQTEPAPVDAASLSNEEQNLQPSRPPPSSCPTPLSQELTYSQIAARNARPARGRGTALHPTMRNVSQATTTLSQPQNNAIPRSSSSASSLTIS